MYNFIHISDLHLAPLPPVSWRQLLNKRLIGYLNWQFNRKTGMKTGALDAVLRHIGKQNYQHLAISGDLVNLALPAEFHKARAKIASLGPARDVSLVFGNHDAYVPGAFAKACAVFAPWIAGDAAPAHIFCYARAARQPAHIAAKAFPYMRIRENMALIGVSSAIATLPFSANGYFGAGQAAALALLLRQAGEKGLFRIVMIHHPPLYHAAAWYKALWGIKRFQNILASCGAELVLHGHTHMPSLSYIKGRHGARIPVIGAASAAQEFGGHKPPAGYNLFSIDKNKRGEWQCVLRRFGIVDEQNHIGCMAEENL